MKKQIVILLIVVGMLIGAGCKEETDNYPFSTFTNEEGQEVGSVTTEEFAAYEKAKENIKSPIRENPKEMSDKEWENFLSEEWKKLPAPKESQKQVVNTEPDAKIIEAWFEACERAAEYQLAGDSKNYLKWKREARRLAILLGY